MLYGHQVNLRQTLATEAKLKIQLQILQNHDSNFKSSHYSTRSEQLCHDKLICLNAQRFMFLSENSQLETTPKILSILPCSSSPPRHTHTHWSNIQIKTRTSKHQGLCPPCPFSPPSIFMQAAEVSRECFRSPLLLYFNRWLQKQQLH